MFKDECGVKSMTDFVGLRPKYAYKMDDGATTTRVKGVTKSARKRHITFDDYKRYLHKQQEVYKSMNIHSHLR